jgi:hypothetical protein
MLYRQRPSGATRDYLFVVCTVGHLSYRRWILQRSAAWLLTALLLEDAHLVGTT